MSDDTRRDDVEAVCVIARDDARQLALAVQRCWQIDLDRIRSGRVETMEWFEREPGYEDAAHPNLRRSNVRAFHHQDRETGEWVSGVAKPAPWTPPAKNSVELAYVEATREIARAHAEMLRKTEWPADDGEGWTPGKVLDVWDHEKNKPVQIPATEARVVDESEMLRAIVGLSQGLEWARVQWQAGDLAPPEASAVIEACNHVGAALQCIPEGLRSEPKRPKQPKRCVHCEDKPREAHRKWCAACRKKHERGMCSVCGYERAA